MAIDVQYLNPYTDPIRKDGLRRIRVIMDSESDFANLPTDAVPDSIAYTADGEKLYRMSPSHQWVEN